ncbi:putative methyltransferase [Aspergillus sclerotialis]|uniref:Putative methyltransferase n=1 Tax=Aspergillus sclerotialis TaxID=2070753 RepID=A0A3A2ZII6_9EURO|nr:putative methyltransferase [Aspergillus sclerotialis]
MLSSRLRPLPRKHQPHQHPTSVPLPNLQDQDDDTTNDPEDVFTSFLPHLFPDDAPPFHGDPGQHLLYSSRHFGDIDIMVPSYPSQSDKPSEEIAAGLAREDGKVNEVEQGRKLFAHFLWSAAMVVAEGIENAAVLDSGFAPGSGGNDDTALWRVNGEKVLELGAGAALPSLLCALANASKVTITDHPSSPAFSGAIEFNTSHNIPKSSSTSVSIEPHEWGQLDTPFALSRKGSYTRIIAADCFWMSSQHENLVRTMLWFLDENPSSRVWVIAGFHTGREIVAGFFETAAKMGLEVERIYERDLVGDAESDKGQEVRREWVPKREDEGPENRRRWCVVAFLKRK